MKMERTFKGIAVMGVVALLLAGYGCEGVKHMAVSLMPTKTAENLEPRIYPTDTAPAAALDIEITRLDLKQIRLDNRTPRPYENVTLWLNGEYGVEIESVPIGQSSAISLATFVNQHGERFPVGGLLEPEKTLTVVLGDLQQGEQLHKLIVHLPENWQFPRGGVSQE